MHTIIELPSAAAAIAVPAEVVAGAQAAPHAGDGRMSGRCRRWRATLRGWVAGWLLCLGLIASSVVGADPAEAQLLPAANPPPPLKVAVLVSSRTDQCFEQGFVAATTALTSAAVRRINADGGIAGRQVEIVVLDDARDPARTTDNVRRALADPTMLAIVGLSNSTNATATFKALGDDIRDKAIPFLSRISVNEIIADHPNVFTTQATQDDERLPVMVGFIRHVGFSRTAFVGLAETVFSRALGDGLKQQLGVDGLVADHRLAFQGTALDPAGLAAMIADLKAKRPDLIALGMGGARAAIVIEELSKAGITPALFVTGSIENLPEETRDQYPNALYQLAWDRLPEADNDRLRRAMVSEPDQPWVFYGDKVPAAPGWAKGECKDRPTSEKPDALHPANLSAIGQGSISADMIELVATAARTAEPGSSLAAMRRRVIAELTRSYASGRGVFKGRFDNWSFNPSTRAAARTPFVVILPRGLGRTQLAPVQFVRVRDGSLRKIETLYLDIDLIRAHHVDDNEKTFFAELYLSMRNGSDSSIEQLDFTNAYVDPRTNGRQISIERLHDGGPSNAYPDGMKVYKVSGRFVFEPDLAKYPFDTQRFSIDLQPRRGDAPFIVQPPPQSLRDKNVATDGWDQLRHYVGYDEDFVPLVDAYTHQPSVVPFYKASFVWMMQRQTTDYYLRVVVPLAFILIVAYLSIFIPLSHFEAIVTIQVTALLSAVALYLSLPKLDSDTATVSDRIFVFNYMMVSLMIVISILRMNDVVAARAWLGATLWSLHVVAVPILVAGVAWLVYLLNLHLG